MGTTPAPSHGFPATDIALPAAWRQCMEQCFGSMPCLLPHLYNQQPPRIAILILTPQPQPWAWNRPRNSPRMPQCTTMATPWPAAGSQAVGAGQAGTGPLGTEEVGRDSLGLVKVKWTSLRLGKVGQGCPKLGNVIWGCPEQESPAAAFLSW